MQPPAAPSRRVLLRDLFLFQIKLWLDGLKDVVLSPLSFAAAAFGVVFRRPALFYKVMRTGEEFDAWLNLYGATRGAEHRKEGLFGGRAPGAATAPTAAGATVPLDRGWTVAEQATVSAAAPGRGASPMR